MDARVREGRTALLITVLLIATLMLPAVLFGNLDPAAGQQGQPSPTGTAPAIQLNNPSDYTGTPQMSDEPANENGGDTDREYHFTATVSNIPPQPLVEFFLLQEGNPPFFLGNGQFVGSLGAVHIEREIPDQEFEEGPDPLDPSTDLSGATVRAILYSNNGATEVSRDEQPVRLNQRDRDPDPQPTEGDPEKAAETVDILYPTHGGEFGLFRPASGGAAVGVLEVAWSTGTDRVQVFYTVSPPDADPTWKSCGNEQTAATTTAARANNGVRCTLVDNDQPEAVTGVAAVAMDTELPANNSVANSGDAHRVAGYSQEPGSVTVTAETVPAATLPGCSGLLNATVMDNKNPARPIAGVNVDLHARGPNDNIAFNTHAAEQDQFDEGDVDQSKAPDNHPTEPGRRCSNDDFSGTQGVHAVGGADDRKHIESVNQADDDGRFVFRLWSDAPGGTRVTAWADTTDDDRLCPNEVAGSNVVTWGTGGDPAPAQDPPEPLPCPNPTSPSGSPGGSPTPTPTVSPSPTPTPSTTTTGTASPTPTPSTTGTVTPTPTPPPTATPTPTPTSPQQSPREITIEASDTEKTFGRSFALSGAVTSDNPACTDFVSVRILRDVVGGSDDFALVAQEQTDTNGAYSTTLRADRSANYVAQVSPTTACDDASSGAQPVLVRVKVILRVSRNRVDPGDRVRFRTRTAPCPDTARDRVLLFRAIEGQFGKSGKKRLNGDCRATFTRRVRSSSVFQTRWPKQSPEFLAGKSRSKAVRVTD